VAPGDKMVAIFNTAAIAAIVYILSVKSMLGVGKFFVCITNQTSVILLSTKQLKWPKNY